MRTARKLDYHKGINELAAEMELKLDQVSLIQNLKTRMISLDHPQES